MAIDKKIILAKLKKWSVIITDHCGRIYRPGMSLKGSVQVLTEWVGDKNIALGAAIVSSLIAFIAFILFAHFSAIFFSVMATALVFFIAKLISYKPLEYSVELDDENTILSFVKYVGISGKSQITVHSQPGYGKDKKTFVLLQLADSILILNCHNIMSVIDNSYRDITINFFHPINGAYAIDAASDGKDVRFRVIEQSADQCRIKFMKPVQKKIKLTFI